MNFEAASIAIEVLEKYTTSDVLEFSDGTRKEISGNFEFEHDQCWVTLPRMTDDPDLTPDERKRLEDANWFFDDDVGAWSHF